MKHKKTLLTLSAVALLGGVMVFGNTGITANAESLSKTKCESNIQEKNKKETCEEYCAKKQKECSNSETKKTQQKKQQRANCL